MILVVLGAGVVRMAEVDRLGMRLVMLWTPEALALPGPM